MALHGGAHSLLRNPQHFDDASNIKSIVDGNIIFNIVPTKVPANNKIKIEEKRKKKVKIKIFFIKKLFIYNFIVNT